MTLSVLSLGRGAREVPDGLCSYFYLQNISSIWSTMSSTLITSSAPPTDDRPRAGSRRWPWPYREHLLPRSRNPWRAGRPRGHPRPPGRPATGSRDLRSTRQGGTIRLSLRGHRARAPGGGRAGRDRARPVGAARAFPALSGSPFSFLEGSDTRALCLMSAGSSQEWPRNLENPPSDPAQPTSVGAATRDQRPTSIPEAAIRRLDRTSRRRPLP